MFADPMFDVAGTVTAEWVPVAWEEWKRRHRPVLVCVRKITDFGNVYTVPGQWCDRIKRNDDGTFVVTVGKANYHVNSKGLAAEAPDNVYHEQG